MLFRLRGLHWFVGFPASVFAGRIEGNGASSSRVDGCRHRVFNRVSMAPGLGDHHHHHLHFHHHQHHHHLHLHLHLHLHHRHNIIIIIIIIIINSSNNNNNNNNNNNKTKNKPKLHVSEKIPGIWTLFSNWHATCFKSEVTMRLRVYLLSFPSGRSFSWAKKTGFFRWNLAVFRPWKLNMEPKNGGLVDDFSFPNGWFLSSMLVF